MATYYKYKSREGEDQIDWRGITKGITDDITRIAGEREEQRVEIDKAVLTNLETLADKPQGQDAGQNQIIANYAEQASAIALENQKLLKSGAITLKEYTARTNTSGSSTKKLFNLSKKYQENYQRHMDSLKPDENGKIQGSGLGALFLKQVETFSNPDTTRYYMDPTTGEAFLAKVGTDETTPGRVATIDGEAYSLMDVGAAGDIISRDVNRYQSNDVATNLADQAGTYVDVIMTGDVKTKEDAFARMFAVDKKGNLVEDGITEEGKAIMTQIKATFASDMDYASMLYDTMGYASVAKNTKGEGYTNLLTGEEYKEMPEQAVLFETVNGQQQPQITDEQKKEAEMGVLKQIRTKLDIKETARADTRMTDYQKASLGLKKAELRKGQKAKEDSLRIKVRSLADLYSGKDVDLKGATEYFRDIDNSVSKVERIFNNEGEVDGISVTYTDDSGNTLTRPIVFTIDNPNFNPDQPEGPDNPKRLKKSQKEFMESASNLLLGPEDAESTEFLNMINAKNKETGEFIFNEGLSIGEAASETGIAQEPGRATYNIATNQYLDGLLESEALDFGGGILNFKDDNLAEGITKQFKDLGVIAEATGGPNNEVLVRLPGINETIIIDASNWTPSGKREEKQKLKNFLKLGIGKLGLEEKLNLSADSKTKGSGSAVNYANK